jgi:glycosyltransferase involved in cell wall biosynthesis
VSPPLVSCVIGAYNGAPFLDQSLRSLAAQSHPRLEVVVVDDGSTDESTTIIDAWSRRDVRIRLIRTAHGGPQHARNIGVAEAQGAFIAHLDQDNIAAPTRVAAQLAWMEANGVDVCGSCTRVFGDHGYVGWVPARHDDILRETIFRCAMAHSTVLLPASIAKTNPFDPGRPCGGDELPIRLSARYTVGNVPQPLVKYRHHDRQRARVEAVSIREDRRRIGREVFRRLFPGATAADEDAVMRVADGAVFDDPAQQALAAGWMARLSTSHDVMVRRLMAERWSAASRPR